MGGVIELVPPEPADIASPCVNVCVIDRATGWCKGCGRTLDEISGWSAASPDAKRAVLARLPGRRAALG